MKVKWSKALLMLAVVSLAPLVMTQAVFSAMQTNSQIIPLSFGTFLGSFLSRLRVANEPTLLLLFGAALIVVGVRIRQVFASSSGQ
jgi:hypothetical protein